MPVVGFEGLYEISDEGRLRSAATGALRSPVPQGKGKHHAVMLYRNCKAKKAYIHRLVLEAFVGPCPPRMEACHDPDRNTANNRLTNLRWDTRQANMQDAVRHGSLGDMCRGVCLRNRVKTHCDHGHPFDAKNTWRDARGRRQCRACHRLKERIRKRARRAQARAA